MIRVDGQGGRDGPRRHLTEPIPQARLRNFSIIAHIDHGKSTLADRLLEMTHTIDARQMTSQVLDSMDLEREKGITIKARSARLEYTANDGLVYGLNLIDTPGHVDFAYEVSHSLQACEGAILVVDATQGIEAQTLANVHLAMREDLTLIPVLNKIDLPSADPDDDHGRAGERARDPARGGHPRVGQGRDRRRRDPRGDRRADPRAEGRPKGPLQGLIFDSHYDAYKGVIVYVRLAQGTLRDGEPVRLMGSGATAEPLELGVFRPQLVPVKQLVAGEVGYVATGLKSVREAQVGDTVTSADRPAANALPGYQPAKSPRVRGHLPGLAARTTRSCATRSRSCTSTTPASRTSRRAPWPSASGSVAGSWACSTWRSSRSAWSASSAST